MARIAIQMPNLGYDMETGRIGDWLCSVGEAVARGQAIVEIETDKSTLDMESVVTGTLVEIVAVKGEEHPVGAVIAWVEDGD
jgi:pyruvate/2-oxoglutarate dehydrogenase complex dihydrolipoamide acyltransferase (E2) component